MEYREQNWCDLSNYDSNQNEKIYKTQKHYFDQTPQLVMINKII
jgi:hypothetical protein